MRAFKPEGYTNVSPYLIVKDATATIGFVEQVLDGRLLRSFPDQSGRLIHAEVRIGDSVAMLADATPDWPPVAAYVHVYVPDVDATYERALAHGAESVQAPVHGQDEDKRGGVRDSGGTTWWISTRQAGAGEP